MKKKNFKAELQPGHKDDAVQVPFNPADVWGLIPEPLWRGRKGHRVRATLNGFPFETFIVPRQRKFFLMVEPDVKEQARVGVGDVVAVTVTPADRLAK